MPIQVDGVLPHTISGTELSRVRTELYQLHVEREGTESTRRTEKVLGSSW